MIVKRARLHIDQSRLSLPALQGLVGGGGAVSFAKERKHAEHIFFSSMALVMLAIVLIGFAPSFFLRGVVPVGVTSPLDDGGSIGPGYFILHGLVFTSWMMLYCAQTLLVASGRIAVHRRLGRAAAIVAPLVVITGLGASFYAARHGFHAVPVPTPTFLAVPILGITLYGVLVWLGWRNRHDPQAHKRYMLLATMGIVGAATARIGLLRAIIPPWFDATLLLLIPLILWDMLSIGRPHRVTLWGGLLLLVVTLGAVPIGMTQPWLVFANLLTGN